MSTTSQDVHRAGARPLRADAARNRERILEAAEAVFSERGREAQIEDVARRAGVGVGTVYRHFSTKQALFDALSDRHWQAIVDRVEGEAMTAEDPWTGFRQMFVIAGEQHERDRGFAEVVAEVRAGRIGPPPKFVEVLDSRAETLLRRAHEAGVVRDDLERTDLHPVFCSLAAITRFGAGDWRRHLDLVLAGLRAPGA